MRPGDVKKREFEYKRHGTQALIASLEVATGKIIASTVRDRRTKMDFAQHIACTIATDPDTDWIFVVDQLNTHKSETIVCLVSAECELEMDPGIKGKHSCTTHLS
jgi:hypothetical protein